MDRAEAVKLFEQYEQHMRALAATIADKLGLTGEYDDFSQELFLAAWRSMRDYDPQQTPFMGWISWEFNWAADTYLKVHHYRKKVKFRKSMVEMDKPVSIGNSGKTIDIKQAIGNPDLGFNRLEQLDAINEWLDVIDAVNLSEYQRKVLAMRIQGWSFDRIAKKCGTTFKSVDNVMYSVRRKIHNLTGSRWKAKRGRKWA